MINYLSQLICCLPQLICYLLQLIYYFPQTISYLAQPINDSCIFVRLLVSKKIDWYCMKIARSLLVDHNGLSIEYKARRLEKAPKRIWNKNKLWKALTIYLYTIIFRLLNLIYKQKTITTVVFKILLI